MYIYTCIWFNGVHSIISKLLALRHTLSVSEALDMIFSFVLMLILISSYLVLTGDMVDVCSVCVKMRL